MKITGGKISNKEAAKGSKEFQKKFKKQIDDGQLAVSGLIDIECMKRIVNTKGVAAMKVYNTIGDSGRATYAFYPADKEGNLILSTSESESALRGGPEEETGENIVALCPPNCVEGVDPISG